MYGDTTVMRKRAAQLREQGSDIRALADRLVAQVEAIEWTGRAAVELRARVTDRAGHLRECAEQHENAAEALERHLAEVDRLKEAIADVERKASSLVADARNRISEVESHDDPDGVRREAADADLLLARFTPPPPGHRDWLAVSLPGL